MVVTAEKHLVLVEDVIGKEIRVRVRELDCSPNFATAFLSMALDASLNSLNLCSLHFMMKE